MCGIAGALVYAPAEARLDGLVAAVAASRARGRDSFGVVRWSSSDGFHRVNDPGDGPTAWLDAVGRPSADEPTVYLHTSRAEPTTEWCRDRRPQDVPPFVAGDVAVAHNGIISNDHELVTRFEVERASPIDSAVVPDLVERLGVWRTLAELRGGSAFAILRVRSSSLVLARNFLPITITWEPGILCFASEGGFFPASESPFKPYQSFDLPPYTAIEVSSRGFRAPVEWGAVPAGYEETPWQCYPQLRRASAAGRDAAPGSPP